MGEPRELMRTHKIVIDADDAEHARWLVEALANDGYRVRQEEHVLVADDDGNCTIKRELRKKVPAL